MFHARRLVLPLLAGLALGATPYTSRAMDYAEVAPAAGVLLVVAAGVIQPGDADRLVSFVNQLAQSQSVTAFVLNSPGGSIVEAEKVAGIVHRTGVPAIVFDGGECSSACFLIFAAAKSRFVGPRAMLGVHSVSVGGADNADAMALTTALARDLDQYGVPPSIVGKLVVTSPQDVVWLQAADLALMGVTFLKPRAAPTPSPYVGSPPERAEGSDQLAANAAPALHSPTFNRGLADRRAWEEWFSGLSGMYRDGALWWSAQRSLRQPGGCVPAGAVPDRQWVAGCLEAHRRLDPSDIRRHEEPEYRAGWNSY
jgi:hypothetical protein